MFSDIDSLILYAGIHQEIYGYYRLLSRRFPYAIYYKLENNNIIVWRVLDCRQEPDKIEKHLVDEILSTFTNDKIAPMAQELKITESVLIIRINKLYRPNMSDDELYEITRGIWKVTTPRRDRVEFVFSVHEYIIKEVYKVNSWHPALSTSYSTRTKEEISLHGEIITDGRCEFIGEIAKPEVRDKYINKSVDFLFSRGAANPVTYVNC